MSLLIKNIKELVTFKGVAKKGGKHPKAKDLSIISNAALYIEKDKIIWMGKQSAAKSHLRTKKYKIIDAQEMIVFPGLIDPHTHLIFGGSRHDEFSWRCEGQGYLDIAKKGGGAFLALFSQHKRHL